VSAPLATFKELLSEQRVDVALAALAAKHVAQALLHMHLRKFVHADLHDECVWLTSCEGKMVVKVAHFSAAGAVRSRGQEAAEPAETASQELSTAAEPSSAAEHSSAAEPHSVLPAAKKHKQSQPLLMSTRGKHNAPESWLESCGGGTQYDEAVDIWAFGWLFRP
jgi:serine/threonine protein kinase